MQRDHPAALIDAATEQVRPRAWLVFGDQLLAQAIGSALEQLGWHVGGVASDIASVERLALRDEPPELVVTGLRFRDGDGFQLMRLLARCAGAPAVFIASREQRAVIRAAASLAQSCGLPVAGFAEQPVSEAAIAAALEGYRRPVSSRRTVSAELSRDELLSMFDRGVLGPWLQPKVRVKTNEVVGFEALMRSSDCDGTLVMPDRLVGALARHYLLDQATLHMAARTVAFVADCLERGMAINASINVSMTSLSNLAFCQELAATVAAAGLDPSWITIEITETDAMTDLGSVIENTGRIRMLGFNLAIDDFGTAYASLMHLVRLPFSELKIERAFIHGSANDSGKQAIVGACARLGTSLGLHVVAEGVETAEEFAYARRAGCTQIQGYLVARPMPVERAMDWLAQLPELRFELPG